MGKRGGRAVFRGMILLMLGVLAISEGLAQQGGWRSSGQALSADPVPPPPLPPLPEATAMPAPKPTPNQASVPTEKVGNGAGQKKPAPGTPSSAPGGPGNAAPAKNGSPSASAGAAPSPGVTSTPSKPGGSALSILDTPSADVGQFCPAPVSGGSTCFCPEDVPFMFGDHLLVPGQVFAGAAFVPGTTPYADIPLAGGSRRIKIADNNRLLPTDRVYFQYNHFHNAFERVDAAGRPAVGSLDQYTLGIEKTFLEGRWSCEVRMPFTGAYQADMAPTSNLPGLGVSTSHYGNLAAIVKGHLCSGRWWALGGGLGVDIPLGSDVHGFIDGTPFAIDNDAVHLLPFGAATIRPTERLFGQAFLQVDVPLNGNRVVLDTTPIGELTPQTLLYVDAALGYWLYQNRCAKWLTGLAGLVEVHYTTPLQNADVFTGTVGGRTLGVGNVWNRQDVVNLTIGLHAEFGQACTLGVGGVVPLDDRPDRAFDAEVQVFFNYRY
ncbi:MAG: hypothetical protein NZ602_12210 [Thermoguttaceae bacterium]|nr:hypothetical protein [Thermoguttaceae bacterium]MDW8037480.1 hypothetical protein [Thermoguttaceae bacterium]